MKAKRCELWISTRFNQIKIGEFKSISACKKYIDECVTSPYVIRVIK